MRKYPADVMFDIDGRPYIFRMSFTTKNGKKVYPKNGKPFLIHLK